MNVRRAHMNEGEHDALETMNGPNVPGLMLAVWKMKTSDVKCPKAIR
jgi:hypothetical protein